MIEHMFDGSELRSMSNEGLVDALRRAHGAAAFAQAAEVRAVREFYRRHGAKNPHSESTRPESARTESPADPGEAVCGVGIKNGAAVEISDAVYMSEQRATALIDIGLALDSLPSTREAFGSGRLDLARVQVIVENVRGLSGDMVDEVETPLVEAAARSTPARLRQVAQRRLAAMGIAGTRREQYEDCRDTRRAAAPLPRRVHRLGASTRATPATDTAYG